MRITFSSSILNHHQILFCEALNGRKDVQFHFVQMRDLTEERKTMGFSEIQKPYVVNARQEREKAYRLCMESDVLIAGVIDQNWVNERVAQGKLTFAYKERFCKEPMTMLRPGFWKNGYKNYFRFRDKNLYLMCASAYTAADTRFTFPRKEKKLKWGYFPQVSAHTDVDTQLANKEPNTILWVGRLIELKHPEICIELAKRLKAEGFRFHMDIVGLGEMQESISKMIKENGLEDCVELVGQKPPEQVRQHMGKSEILIFTSDRREGWGAVVNEGMSEGCACISAKEAGSTNFLIQDGKNGYSYRWNDLDTLADRVKQLLGDKALLRDIQRQAIETISCEWNAEIAAQRLVAFCEALLSDEEPPHFATGPMSIAEE